MISSQDCLFSHGLATTYNCCIQKRQNQFHTSITSDVESAALKLLFSCISDIVLKKLPLSFTGVL